MTNTIDLNKMGLAPLNEVEMQEVDGGVIPPVWVAIGVGVAACAIYDFTVSFCKGFYSTSHD